MIARHLWEDRLLPSMQWRVKCIGIPCYSQEQQLAWGSSGYRWSFYFLWFIISTVLHLVIPMGLVSPCLGRVLNAKSKHALNLPLKIPCSGTDPCQNEVGMDPSHRWIFSCSRTLVNSFMFLKYLSMYLLWLHCLEIWHWPNVYSLGIYFIKIGTCVFAQFLPTLFLCSGSWSISRMLPE